jgi:hypothetical protein
MDTFYLLSRASKSCTPSPALALTKRRETGFTLVALELAGNFNDVLISRINNVNVSFCDISVPGSFGAEKDLAISKINAVRLKLLNS